MSTEAVNGARAGRDAISSTANPRIKRALRLRRRPHRDAAGLTLIEGRRELALALDAGHLPREVFFCKRFLDATGARVLERCRRLGVPALACTATVMGKLAYRDPPQGLVAVAPLLTGTLNGLDLPADPLVLVADSVEKPGNLGAVLRSCDAAGADAVVVCGEATDLSNPSVVRASLGTLFRLSVARAAEEETRAWLRDRGLRLVAASPSARKVYTEADLTGGVAIAVGSEDRGLGCTWLKEADLCVRIPMLGSADSLNVSAAAALLLYEARRQRTPGS